MCVYVVVKECRGYPPGAQEWRDSYIKSWSIDKVFADGKMAKEYIKNKPDLSIVRRRLQAKKKTRR